MNANTSEILAMANWPGYDPSNLEEASDEQLQNRATGFTYEPGSTFKAFTVAAALEDEVVTPETSFYLPSEIQVADREIGEAHERPPIDATVSQILAQSSNVGAVRIGLAEGADRFSRWINNFGFGRVTGLDYPGEERGSCPSAMSTPARRWGTCRSARVSPSPRFRWRPDTRRSRTAGSCGSRA